MATRRSTIHVSVNLHASRDDNVHQAIYWALNSLLRPAGIEIVESPHEPGIVYGQATGRDHLVLNGDDKTWLRFIAGERFRKDDFGTATCLGENIPVLLTMDGKPDFVATTFFFLSGYDEHQTIQRDRHGRFQFGGSLADQLCCSRIPVVDYVRQHILSLLDKRPRESVESKWSICPTVDIDYIRKWSAGVTYREFVQSPLYNVRREPLAVRLRRAVSSGAQFVADHNVYKRSLTYIRKAIESRGGRGTFFLKGGAADPYDVPYKLTGWTGRFVREAQDARHEIGLHPSYWAASDCARLEAEKSRLEDLVRRPVTAVRSHYLRWSGNTRSLYAAAGFEVDSTLGYSDTIGFRRGTCLPFTLFDLDAWTPLDLVEHPLIAMDSALFNRMHLSVDEAVSQTQVLLDHVRRIKRFGGSALAQHYSR